MRKRWSCLKVVIIANSHSQKEQHNLMTEMRDWERQYWCGINLFEEKVAKIFLMNRKGLHQQRIFKTHIRMPVMHEMISGPSEETSKVSITLNQESNSTRRGKNHFLFHWKQLTWPESLILRWMYCRKAASMITGTSIDQEICPTHWQVSRNFLCWRKSLQKDTRGRKRD